MSRPVAYYPDQLPMSIIHQKNSNPLVNTWFEGFHDLLIYTKVMGDQSCDTNFWTPCSIELCKLNDLNQTIFKQK